MAVRSSVLRPPVIRTTGMGGKVIFGRMDVICSGGSGRYAWPLGETAFIFITISPLQHSAKAGFIKYKFYRILPKTFPLTTHVVPSATRYSFPFGSYLKQQSQPGSILKQIFYVLLNLKMRIFLHISVLKSTGKMAGTYHRSKTFGSKCWAGRLQCLALEDQCCHYSKLCS